MPVLELRHLVGPGRSYSIHVEEKAGSWSYPEHSHDGFGDLLLVERGRMHQRVNGEAMVLEPGHVVLVRPGDRHELWGDGLRFVNLNLPRREWQRLSSFDGEALPLGRLEGAASAPRAVLAASQRQEMQSDLAGLIAGEAEPEAPVLLARFLLRWLPLLAPRAAAAAGSTPPAWFDP
ncbi:MAG: AraC family ligand binding domain-containing protein, partial [Planctomycetes bacterium]|nr:AraC family ligand binding domain-containing protein [Planctomycetota bacterium]